MPLQKSLASIALALLTLVPAISFAAPLPQLTVTPVVIDNKAKARDILQEKVSITNATEHKLSIYPSVNNVAPKDGEQAFTPAQRADALADSLANWIELSRGVIELSPGETREVPFIIHVNFNAVPGTYHANISFGAGTTRAEAEAAGSLATVVVNIEVQRDVKEILQLGKFATGKFFLAGDDVRFDYQLENIGNQELQPRGEIRIYDRTGVEVASVDVNKEGKDVSPEQMSQLASVWTAAQGFGQYKALLTVYYGKSQTASVQDTIFFWIVPWKQLLALFVTGLIAVIFAAFYIHRRMDGHPVPTLATEVSVAHASVPASRRVPTFRLPQVRLSPLLSLITVPARFALSSVRSVARLKRGERRLSTVSQPATVPAAPSMPTPEPMAPAAPPVSQHHFSTHATIDLKNLRSQVVEPVSEGHVIDLKKLR